MSSKHLAILGCVTLILLFITNMVTLNAYLAASRQLDRSKISMKNAAENLKEQSTEAIKLIQNSAQKAFLDIIENMKLFRKLSDESEVKMKRLIEERRLYLNALQQNSVNKIQPALKVIDADDKIVQTYIDYVRLQAMHREKLIDKLEPLAATLGFKSPDEETDR